MHGGDSLFGRMSSQAHVYRDSGVDSELDHKAYKVTEKLSECINTIANEPSVAFYRIQEHVRKTLPQLVEQKHEVEEVQQLVQGACFDTEYAGNAVKGMQKSVVHFQNIQELLKNAMFMKQQIDYEEARKRQGKPAVPGTNGGGRAEGGANTSRAEEGSDTNMNDSAVSTDSSLVASAHMCSNSEPGNEVYTENAEEQASQADLQQKTVKETKDTTLPDELKDKPKEKDMVDTEGERQEANTPNTDEYQNINTPNTEHQDKDTSNPDKHQDMDTPNNGEHQDKATPNTEIIEQKHMQNIEDKEQNEWVTSEDKELEDADNSHDQDQEDTSTNSGDEKQGDAQATYVKQQKVTAASVDIEKENIVEESRKGGRDTAETEQPSTTTFEGQAESRPDSVES